MAESMFVFVESSQLPTVRALRKKVSLMGLELEEWEEELRAIEGFWPGKLRGQEVGFEFCIDKLQKEDKDELALNTNELNGRDYMIELSFYNELDVEAAVICVVALCQLSDGISFNENEELKVNRNNALEWAKDEMGYHLEVKL